MLLHVESNCAMKFDIAIIGAGTYGLLLATYVKNPGQKSIHLGGAVQTLFGIKRGRRITLPCSRNFNPGFQIAKITEGWPIDNPEGSK